MQLTFDRAWPLEDIQIVSRAKGGDGRTVEAYAAVFDTPSEVRDKHGHYIEEIARTAFDKTIAERGTRVGVYYNHGMTAHGTPSELGSVPIGSPLEIRADQRGLFTVTRYNKSALADSVLEAIRNGDIRAQSFRGGVYKASPMRPPRARPGQPLQLWRHLELGLKEYGPTPDATYEDAAIMAVRSAQQIVENIAGLDETERAELIRMLSSTTPLEPGTNTATPEAGAGTEEPRSAHSGRQALLRLRAKIRDRSL